MKNERDEWEMKNERDEWEMKNERDERREFYGLKVL